MKSDPFSKTKYFRLPSVFFWRPAKRQWQAIFKGMVACLITSGIFMATPVTQYFGALGYLIIAMVMITPPFLPLGSHIESFIVATIGIAIGLGISALGMVCFTTANKNIGAPSGRWIAFAFLLTTAFLFGYGKAKYPKLAMLWIIGFIPPLYIFTVEVDNPHFSFLFPCKILILQVAGCLITLIVNFVFWPVSSTALVCNNIISALTQTREILSKLPEALKTTDYDAVQSYQLEVKATNIQMTMFKLTDMFRQARYEITYGKIDPRQIVHSVGNLVKLQHHLRMLLKSVLDGQKMRNDSESHQSVNIDIYEVNRHNLEIPRNNERLIHLYLDILIKHTPELIYSVVVAINRLIEGFEFISDQSQPIMSLPQEQLPYQVDESVTTGQLLADALTKFELVHATVSEELHAVSNGDDANDSILIASAYMYSIKQVIVSVQQIVESKEELRPKVCKRKRLWWPKVSFSKWLHSDSQKEKEIRAHKDTSEDESDSIEDDDDEVLSAGAQEDHAESRVRRLGVTEEKESASEPMQVDLRERSRLVQTQPAPARKESIGTYLYEIQKEKENKRTFRRLLWEFLRWCRSERIVYAFKFTIIFGCLALPAYFDSSMAWYSSNHGQWSLITANIVSNVAIGAVFTIGVQRFIGTILGGFWGLAVWEISRSNQYALPVCFTVFSFPLWYLFIHNPLNKVGSVSLTAYVAVIFNEWVYRKLEKRPYLVAIERIASVDAGILMTFLVHSFIAPYIARVELRLELSHIFNLDLNIFSSLFNIHNVEKDGEEDRRIQKQLSCDFTKVLNSLMKSQALFAQSMTEPRLRGPFQSDVYREILTRLKHMLDLTLVIRSTLNQLPQECYEKYMMPINEYRREFMSILVLNLYNVSGALRTKSPMPRYLPSVSGIRQLLCEFAFQKLPVELRSNCTLTTYYTYAWALLEFSIEEEIIIELVKGIVGETELNIRLDPSRSVGLPNQRFMFQDKQPHQMKHV
ncbi:hypothetical protein K7432_005862 [Basidiobolus ranarum]|uniref:DUF2421 domain-containing protein n=1 Tax=Basidiobolus ranarum TaxID=34480 RepID=A0ABR2WVY7_9FUNG